MLKILHTSDSHWSARGRLEDLVDVHRAMLEQAAAESVDVILHAGDFYDARSTPEERTALADWLKAAAELAPFVGVRGNHDVPGDLEIFNRLETRHPVRIVERVTAAPGSALRVELAGGRAIGVLGLAWVDKVNLAAQLEATADAEATRQATIAGVRGLLDCLRAEASRIRSEGAVPVMVAHVMIGGSVVSTGQMLIGQAVELSAADLLDVGAAYVACGHIHASQDFYGGRVAYSGSPARHTFGEDEAKGWRLVTLSDTGELVSNEFRELPARRLVLLEADWSDEAGAAKLRAQGINVAFALGERDRVREARVRFRVRVRAQDLAHVDVAAIEKVLLADGAAEVKVEILVVAETRARAPEIVRATSTGEKLEAWLAAKGIPVDEAARPRLRAKLAQLEGGEEGARAAA